VDNLWKNSFVQKAFENKSRINNNFYEFFK